MLSPERTTRGLSCVIIQTLASIGLLLCHIRSGKSAPTCLPTLAHRHMSFQPPGFRSARKQPRLCPYPQCQTLLPSLPSLQNLLVRAKMVMTVARWIHDLFNCSLIIISRIQGRLDAVHIHVCKSIALNPQLCPIPFYPFARIRLASRLNLTGALIC
jgi:hypothetical protein